MGLFTKLADFITYNLLSLQAGSKIAASLHFFIEDVTKIFFLLLILIYLISLLRAGIQSERVRSYLSGKKKGFGYIIASLFGAVTPFCSCSSIPLFIGFTKAAIPMGITMAFLITSPIINEVALVLLGSLLGWKFMVLYAAIGIGSGIIGGIFFDAIRAERFLTPFAAKQAAATADNLVHGETVADENEGHHLSFLDRHRFAAGELSSIFGRIWKWVLIGVGLGAFLHGYVPQQFIIDNLGAGNIWTVPAAVLIGIPLYSNASGIIPVAETLITKGLPIGTTIAFMLSTVAASLPEFMLLKQVMKTRLLMIFFGLLLVIFTMTGYILNTITF